MVVQTRSRAARKKILCLGVSYADVAQHFEKREQQGWPSIPAATRQVFTDTTVDAAVQCVRAGLLTQMDGRDLARCRSTEETCQAAVYTVSQEQGAVYREDRHLHANFNRHDFVRSLRKRFGKQTSFHQVILDYFWIPQGWDANHWGQSFFERNLVAFATDQLLTSKGSAIYLPFCLHCFKHLQISFPILRKYYNISFLRKNDLNEITLWKGTQQIDQQVMQHTLGKHRSQEDTYCTFGPKAIAEAMEDPRVSKKDLVHLARSLEDFCDIRFMRLELLPPTQHRGNFIGTIHPSKVKRGFDQLALTGLPSPSASTFAISKSSTKTKNPPAAARRKSTMTSRKRKRSKPKTIPARVTPPPPPATAIAAASSPRHSYPLRTTPQRNLFSPPMLLRNDNSSSRTVDATTTTTPPLPVVVAAPSTTTQKVVSSTVAVHSPRHSYPLRTTPQRNLFVAPTMSRNDSPRTVTATTDDLLELTTTSANVNDDNNDDDNNSAKDLLPSQPHGK